MNRAAMEVQTSCLVYLGAFQLGGNISHMFLGCITSFFSLFHMVITYSTGPTHPSFTPKHNWETSYNVYTGTPARRSFFPLVLLDLVILGIVILVDDPTGAQTISVMNQLRSDNLVTGSASHVCWL